MGLDVLEIGMGSDLSLDLRYFASKAVRQARDAAASDVDACIRRLEEERGKIEMFRRELPLCARLLAEVIDVMKAEAGTKTKGDRKAAVAVEEDGAAGDKSKWMSTAQLWTGDSGREDAESEKQDKGRSSPEAKSHGGGGAGAFLPFKAVGSGAPAFAPLCLRADDKAANAGTPDLSLLSPPAIKSAPAAAGAAQESRRQVVGFAQAAARAVAMAPAGPSLSLQSQPQQTSQQQQQQAARKARRTWSPELHRQFVAALNQLGGAQGEPSPES
ncbi:hypothetical protein PVAP13_2NG008600 [Panicum virgatum]|uniref:HHO5-like N-terminal domain-containing protein n=1 Tax=Panicum virgatum TaxID=38727 RepID=A0A8T0VAD6_PANVG|nr:hypothetical protein PVAP13_2NG008600 [Panicum virgatum]